MTAESFPAQGFPLAMTVDVLDRMVNLEIADDPHYSGLEIQGFDDPRHGSGVVVFFARRADEKIDVYFESGLRVDRRKYAISHGLGRWTETEFDVARLSVGAFGVDAEVRFTDVDGRLIELSINDRLSKPRKWASFLAPGGAAIAEPESMPLWWMGRFDLLRRGRTEPVIRIDGRDAMPGRLPLEPLLRRRLIKVASGILVIDLVPDEIGEGAEDCAVVSGGAGVERLEAMIGGHEVVFGFDPEFPDLRNPAQASGAWMVSIDQRRIIAGTWGVTERSGTAEIALDVTQGWEPHRLPPLMTIVTRVIRVFRRWPTTYRWRGSFDRAALSLSDGGWERIGTERGESFRSVTRSS